jgi:hypothetical protein
VGSARLHHNRRGGNAPPADPPNFFIHNSLVFDGSPGPLAIDNWITNFQDLADALRFTDSQKVNYAALKFVGKPNIG